MPQESKRAVEQGQARENMLEHQCLCRLECIQGIITPRASPYVAGGFRLYFHVWEYELHC